MACSTIRLLLVRTTTFKPQDRERLGEPDSAGKPRNLGAGGSGEPPTSLAWTRSDAPVLCTRPSFRAGARERNTTRWEDKGGQVEVTLLPKKKKRLNSRLLYLLSVEINKVLGLQICWYGGLDDMTKGRVGRETGGAPGRPARWAPLGRPAVWPRRTTPSTACGACGPRSPALASPFLKGLSAGAGAAGQSSGPTA